MEYVCKLCGKKFEKCGSQHEYNNKNAITKMFNKHLKNDHKITLEEYIIQTEFNGNIPTCECGCGEKLMFCKKNAIWNPSESFFVSSPNISNNLSKSFLIFSGALLYILLFFSSQYLCKSFN